MVYVCFCSLSILLLLSFFVFRKISCPIVFLNVLFFAIFLGLVISPFDLIKNMENASLMVLLGQLFINIGFYIGYSLKTKTPKDSETEIIVNSDINYILLYPLFVITLVFTFYYVNETRILLNKGYSLNMVRMFYFSGQEWVESVSGYKRNSFISIGTTYLYEPCQYLLITLASMAAFNKNFLRDNKKTKTLLIVITVLNIGISMLTSGGRVVLYYLILSMLFSFSLHRRRNTMYKRAQKKWLVVALLVVIPLLIVAFNVTQSRSSSSIFRSVYYYFCGSIANMEINLANFQYDYYTYGFTFVSGLIRPFFTAIRFVFGLPIPPFFDLSDSFLFDAATTNLIGEGVNYNTFVTMFYFFYRDLGFIGVIVESLIIGLVIAIIYKKVRIEKNNYRCLAIYFVVMIGLSMAFIRWQIVSVGFALTFIYLPFIFKRKRIIRLRGIQHEIWSNKEEFGI